MHNLIASLAFGTFILCGGLLIDSLMTPTYAFVAAEAPGSMRPTTVRERGEPGISGWPDHQKNRSWFEQFADGLGWFSPRKWADYNRKSDRAQRRDRAWSRQDQNQRVQDSCCRPGPWDD